MKKLLDFLKRTEEFLAMILLGIMVVFVFASAVGRFAGMAIPWAVDFSQLLFTWFTFIAASVTWRKDGHVSVDLFYTHFPKWLQTICDYINLIVPAVFLGICSTYSVILAWKNRLRVLSAMGISYSFVTISVAIFGYIMLVITLIRIVRKIMGKPEVLEPYTEEYDEEEIA